MSKQLRLGGFVSEFVAEFPAIPLPLDIDVTTLEAGDGAPFFVTLPIVPEIGVVSGNGLLYDDELVSEIEAQINAKRPGANFGHLPEETRDVAFPHPKAFWVGALRVGQTLWAKCYVPAGEAREHLKNLRAVGGKIATSIFGRGDYEDVKRGVKRLMNFELETVDFAPPERAALGYAAPVLVTAEMDEDAESETNMGNEVVTEMAQVSEQIKAQIIAEYEQEAGTKRTIAELTTRAEVAEQELENVREQLRGHAVAEVRRTVRDRVAELTKWQVSNPDAMPEVEAFRRTVAEFAQEKLRESTDIVQAKQVVDGVWTQMQPLAETLRDKLAGPAAVVNGRVRETGGRKPLEDTPEARQRARAEMGI